MKKFEKEKNISLYGKKIFLQIFLLIFIVFISILVSLNNRTILQIDNFVFNILEIFRKNYIIDIFYIFTLLGETVFIVTTIIVLLISKQRKRFIPLIILLVISVVINTILKNIICRTRPDGLFLQSELFTYTFPSSFSFPSGHSQNGLVFYYMLFDAIVSSKKDKKNITLKSLSIAIPILIMLSRIVIGVHYFTDVLTGALIGILLISIYKSYFEIKLKNCLKINKN